MDKTFRGDGNPSLDMFWNGSHAGFTLMHNNIDDFIKIAQSHGFVGIQYHGGIKFGDKLRGGGGVKHTSYCFWDDDYINSCRVDTSSPEYKSIIPNINNLKISDWKED
jgi:hypothetical protein